MRRLIDIFVAAVTLIFLSPFFLILAIAIRRDSPGPAFYGGWRVGRFGRPFRMWKFRTMVANADHIGPSITSSRDPRITRLGSLLRRTKLDELPQFWNLLIGDLTLVGPRPEAPDIVEVYTPEQRKVLDVKPGITGPGQLQYVTEDSELIPAGVPADQYYVQHLLGDKLKLDLRYSRTRTAASDARIVLGTMRLMVRAIFTKGS